MTTAVTQGRPAAATPSNTSLGRSIVRVMTTTDHKVIGKLYLATSFGWFLIGGVMAMVMRSELAYPGQQVVNEELYNQLFTMHGTIMLLLFATPLFFGFGNAIMPLQIGAPDVAFPRLNMLQLLAVPVRRPDRRLRVPDPAGRGRLRLVRLRPAERRRAQPRASAATCGSWACGWPAWAPSWRPSTSSPRSSACARPG